MAAFSSAEKQQELIDIANSIVADGKGKKIIKPKQGILTLSGNVTK